MTGASDSTPEPQPEKSIEEVLSDAFKFSSTPCFTLDLALRDPTWSRLTASTGSTESVGRIIRDAFDGNKSALSALRDPTLNDVSVLQEFLPIWAILFEDAPIPEEDCNLDREPSENEVTMKTVLAQLLNFSSPDPPPHIKIPIQEFFMTHADDILCWLAHLFHNWAFRRPRPNGHNDTPQFPLRTIRIIVATLFRVLSAHPDMEDTLKMDPTVGSLLAEIHLLAIRESDETLLKNSYLLLERMLTAKWGEWPSKLAFLETLELHSVSFAEGIVSHLRLYARAKPFPMDHWEPIHFILMFLNNAAERDNVLLEACLGQKGLIRAIMVIFVDAVRSLETCNLKDDNAIVSAINTVTLVARFLIPCFEHCGSSMISVTLGTGYDLLDPVVRLDKLLITERFDDLEDTHSDLGRMGNMLFAILLQIIRFAVYPSVLRKLQGFFQDYEHNRPTLKLYSNSPSTFHQILGVIKLQLHEEFTIIAQTMVRAKSTNSSFWRMYKFCDNAECPSEVPKNTRKRLGYCTNCDAAYYCSRSCQKSGWIGGHRKECKAIVESTKDGREGFPPVVSDHDLEYMRRMAVPRLYHYYKNKLDPATSPFNEQAIFILDLTAYPAELHYSTHDALEPGDADNGDLKDLPGPVLKVKYPQCRKLGSKEIVIIVPNVPSPRNHPSSPA